MRAGNHLYAAARDLPEIIPLFPLPGALLLPLGQMPLNVFEPRYLAMVDHALGGDRIIGMIQPLEGADLTQPGFALEAVGCAGRVTSWGETGDGRYLMTLTGVARFRVVSEVETEKPYRLCRVSYDEFAQDFAETDVRSVDRAGLLKIFREFLDAHSMSADWESIDRTPTELLVNMLAMMSPYGNAEKQALLEAGDLETRAATLVALTEASLGRKPTGRSLN